MTNQPSPAPIVPELLDVTKICTTFPSTLGIQIPRDNIHHTLETILGGDVELISLEGPEGMGKTTVLAQFAKRHLNRCISMFVSPNSRFVYDPTIQSADLCNQMNWILHNEEVPTDRASDPSLYHQLVMKLQRNARRSAEPFYFLVDGFGAGEPLKIGCQLSAAGYWLPQVLSFAHLCETLFLFAHSFHSSPIHNPVTAPSPMLLPVLSQWSPVRGPTHTPCLPSTRGLRYTATDAICPARSAHETRTDY